MNLAHLHLVLNHVPVIGMLLALALMFAAAVRRSEELKRVSLALLVVFALIAIPVFFTGEPAEDVVEHLPGVSKAAISQHEGAAEIALAGMEVVGALALVGLLLYRRAPATPRWFFTVAVLLAIVVAGLMARTANLGGQIRHTEVSGSAPPASAQPDD